MVPGPCSVFSAVAVDEGMWGEGVGDHVGREALRLCRAAKPDC